MKITLLLSGLLLGMINAAPVGPVGLICLRKNIAPDRWTGVFSAFGMAAAYGIVAFLVVFGLKSISRFLADHETVLEIVGGGALIYMGWRGLHAAVPGPASAARATRYLGDFSACFAMTLFNPVPFASFAVILTTFKIVHGELDLLADFCFAFSVAAGTLLFWLVVNQILHFVKKRSPEMLSRWISHATSVVLIVFGLVIAGKGIF